MLNESMNEKNLVELVKFPTWVRAVKGILVES
jgi:hypothetical protein